MELSYKDYYGDFHYNEDICLRHDKIFIKNELVPFITVFDDCHDEICLYDAMLDCLLDVYYIEFSKNIDFETIKDKLLVIQRDDDINIGNSANILMNLCKDTGTYNYKWNQDEKWKHFTPCEEEEEAQKMENIKRKFE